MTDVAPESAPVPTPPPAPTPAPAVPETNPLPAEEQAKFEELLRPRLDREKAKATEAEARAVEAVALANEAIRQRDELQAQIAANNEAAARQKDLEDLAQAHGISASLLTPLNLTGEELIAYAENLGKLKAEATPTPPPTDKNDIHAAIRARVESKSGAPKPLTARDKAVAELQAAINAAKE